MLSFRFQTLDLSFNKITQQVLGNYILLTKPLLNFRLNDDATISTRISTPAHFLLKQIFIKYLRTRVGRCSPHSLIGYNSALKPTNTSESRGRSYRKTKENKKHSQISQMKPSGGENICYPRDHDATTSSRRALWRPFVGGRFNHIHTNRFNNRTDQNCQGSSALPVHRRHLGENT